LNLQARHALLIPTTGVGRALLWHAASRGGNRTPVFSRRVSVVFNEFPCLLNRTPVAIQAMKNSIPDLPPGDAGLLDLGSVVGQYHSFALVAGRCSAAHAATLKRLREDRQYLRISPSWRAFCNEYLKVSQTQADHVIRLWDEFGAGYFELAQLTRISPETYRAIAPAIRNGTLESNGLAIELSVENSRKVAAAVAELRRSLPAANAPSQISTPERLARLDKRCAAIAAEFEEISRQQRHGDYWLQFTEVLMRCSAALRRIESENGLT
jgi:hypothetical protein